MFKANGEKRMDNLLRYRRRYYIFHKVFIFCSVIQFLAGLTIFPIELSFGIILNLFNFYLAYWFFKHAMETYQDFKSVDNVVKETKRMGF